MDGAAGTAGAGEAARQRSLPPVTQLGMLSLALIVAGGIYLSAHLPGRALTRQSAIVRDIDVDLAELAALLAEVG